MKLHEAAHIIGSLGGRPSIYERYRKRGTYGGGGTGIPSNAYSTEDILNFYTDETGNNFYVTEI